MGATKQAKGRGSGRQRRQATRRVQWRQGKPTPQGASPPGAWFAPFPSAARVQARGCKGRSPLHENNLNLPLPRRGRGAGGWGQQSKLKAGATGGKEGKPPAGYSGGKVSRHRRGKPRRVRDYATPSQCRPGSAAGLLHGKGCTCRKRFNAGDARGEAPCMK